MPDRRNWAAKRCENNQVSGLRGGQGADGREETYADGACIGKIIVKMEGVGWEQGRQAGGITGTRADRKEP